MTPDVVLPILGKTAVLLNLAAFFGGCLHGYIDYRNSIRSRRD